MKTLFLIAVLLVGQSVVVRTRDSDGAMTFYADGMAAAQVPTKTGETVRTILSANFTTATTASAIDDDTPIYRFAAGHMVLRSPAVILAERAVKRRKFAVQVLVGLQSQLVSVQSVLATTTTTELAYQQRVLQSQIASAKTTAGITP